MNWDAIGAIGELLSAIAVLVTLVYLAVQVRYSRDLLEENRKLALSQVYQGRANFRRAVHSEFGSPEVSKIAAKITQGDGPSDDAVERFHELEAHEQTQYRQVQEQWCVMMDDTLLQIELGLLDDRAIESAHTFIRNMYPWWVAIGCTISPRLRDWAENQNLQMLGS